MSYVKCTSTFVHVKLSLLSYLIRGQQTLMVKDGIQKTSEQREKGHTFEPRITNDLQLKYQNV